MKRRQRLSLALLGALLALSVNAAPVDSAIEEKLINFGTVEKTASGFDLQMTISTPELLSILPSNPTSVGTLELPTEEFYASEGYPAVPVSGKLFRIPARGSVSLEILDSDYELYSGEAFEAYLSSVQYDQTNELNEVQDVWFPEVVAKVTEPAIFRDFRVSSLVTTPVQVNMARREARVYTNLNVKVTYNDNASINELENAPVEISELFVPYYQEFLDWSDSELDEYRVVRGGIQVVVKQSQAVLGQLNPWIRWKEEKGYSIEILNDADVSSWNESSIKAELRARYAINPFDYVVIVGDGDGDIMVPAGESAQLDYSTGYGDHEYTLMAGDDDICDVALGRISVNSITELRTYVTKVLNYEKNPYIDELAWYKHGLSSAGSGSSGMSTVMMGRWAQKLMLEHGLTVVDTTWYTDGGGDVNSRNRNIINNGVSFFSYRGWLNSGLSVSEITGLQNDFMTPMVIDITCGTGSWYQGRTSLSEAWIRAGSPQIPRGAIAAYGMYTAHTNTRANNAMCSGAIQSFFRNNNQIVGGSYIAAQMNLYRTFHGFEDQQVHAFSTWFNLMGDPSLWIWTDTPKSLDVTANSTYNIGQNGYSVNVCDGNGVPVEGAWVTLYRSDIVERVVATGKTDASGDIVLDVSFEAAGSAKLTVTGRNYRPEKRTITIENAGNVAIVATEIVDGGETGTTGNQNGIAESGETVGLRFTLKNYGDSDVSDLSISMTSEDEAVVSVTGTASVSTIATDAEVEAEGLVLVTIEPETQNNWNLRGDIAITSGEMTVNDKIKIDVCAPDFAFVGSQMNGNLLPGQTVNMSVTLKNISDVDFAGGSVRFVSMDPIASFSTAPINLQATASTIESETGEIEVSAHQMAFRGHLVQYKMIVESTTGQTDTTYSSLNIGTRLPEDPCGPDKYGYYAFEDSDTGFELAPEYDWVEINPSHMGSQYPGTRMPINDITPSSASGTTRDEGAVVSLPFTVKYYGEEYNQVSVLGNGMIAMGAQTSLSFARNWPIPSPIGPDNIIAPFWDDREVPSNAGVYTYSDTENGRFIVEWFAVPDANGTGASTFQLILYDQVGEHVTFTGDTDILFQYKDVNPTAGSHADNKYFTTGICNRDHSDGLQIEYWRSKSPGAHGVSDLQAILFTTNVQMLTGSIAGNVKHFCNGQVLSGATVTAYPGGYSADTNEDGDYVIEDVVIGRYRVVGSCAGYNAAIVQDTVVFEDATTTVDLELKRPLFEIDRNSIEETLALNSDPHSCEIPMVISNNGCGELEYTVGVELSDPTELNELWQLRGELPLYSGEARNRGVAVMGDDIWVSGSDGYSSNTPNKMYRYDFEGNLLGTYDQPVEEFSATGFLAITTDGEFLYGAESGVLVKMHFTGTALEAVETIDIPSNPARFLTYDNENDLFWMGDTFTDFYGVDRSGETQETLSLGTSARAVTWFAEDDQDKCLYVLENAGSNAFKVVRMNPIMGTDTREVLTTLSAEGLSPLDVAITNRWNPMIWGLTILCDGGNEDKIVIYEADGNTAWITVDVEEGSVSSNGSATITASLISNDLPMRTFNAWLDIRHNADNDEYHGQTVIPVTLTVVDGVGEKPEEMPYEWAFDGAYPNPFNPSTNIVFMLKERADVKLQVYNVLGREVASLLNRSMNAGKHTVQFNGLGLASGVYFVRFEAGPMNEMKKIILMK